MTAPPPPRLRLLTLDLDDTVWPLGPVIQAAEEALHAWLGEQAPELTRAHDRESLRERRRLLIRERPEIAHDIGLVRRVAVAQTLIELGWPDARAAALAEAALAVFVAHRNRVEPYPDAAPALARLGARHTLVSVTNGNADPECTPLRGVFAHRVTAAAAGASKPDPAVFRMALELTGCAPEDCLHVGDEPYLDVEAARSLGLAAVWIDRYRRPWPDDLPPPMLRVTDLHQLADWLDGAHSPTPPRSAPDAPGDPHAV